MPTVDQMKEEIKSGLRLIPYKSVSLTLTPMAIVEEAMQESGDWHPVSAITSNDPNSDYQRYYYNTALKSYALLSCGGYKGNAEVQAEIQAVEESEVLERLSFQELKTLGGMIDKKSVAFIRIYAVKELEAAKTEEERDALDQRNAKMIQEAETALRKR